MSAKYNMNYSCSPLLTSSENKDIGQSWIGQYKTTTVNCSIILDEIICADQSWYSICPNIEKKSCFELTNIPKSLFSGQDRFDFVLSCLIAFDAVRSSDPLPWCYPVPFSLLYCHIKGKNFGIYIKRV